MQENLFAGARATRDKTFGRKVMLWGTIEASSHCRGDCECCGMRRSNRLLDRYRLSSREIIQAAEAAKDDGLKTIFMQSGEDVDMDKILMEAIPSIRKNLGLAVILCIGNREKSTYHEFKNSGVEGFMLKFETSNPVLFKKLRHEPLEERLERIAWLKELGFKVGTGNIIGIPGQDAENIAEDLELAARLHPNYISATPMIPNENTPLEGAQRGNLATTLNAIAIYRIMLKGAFIQSTSALEILKTGGQTSGLNAGANLITVNYTPEGFSSRYPVYSKNRLVVSLSRALETIDRAGLKPNLR
jgi:biotin synthase